MDEIGYFAKRDKYKTRKDVGSGWNKLKKEKSAQSAKVKPSKSPSKEEEKSKR